MDRFSNINSIADLNKKWGVRTFVGPFYTSYANPKNIASVRYRDVSLSRQVTEILQSPPACRSLTDFLTDNTTGSEVQLGIKLASPALGYFFLFSFEGVNFSFRLLGSKQKITKQRKAFFNLPKYVENAHRGDRQHLEKPCYASGKARVQ